MDDFREAPADRDRRIQDALDRLPRQPGDDASGAAEGDAAEGDVSGADGAAYAIVYAALDDDAGFELPAGFAEALAAQAMPDPPRPSVYERWVLPVLLVASALIALPAVVPGLAGALEQVLAAGDGGVPTFLLAATALLLVAVAERVARRRGWAPRT